MTEALETWNIHNSMNSYLLDVVTDNSLADTAPTRGRTVGEQFAHIHNVRLLWLRAAAPELLEGLNKVEKEAGITKQLLQQSLDNSSKAISKLLGKGFAEGRIKGFKPHPFAFLGYLISHESHHRGQIILTLKANGHLPDKKVLFGLWEWGKPKDIPESSEQ